MQLCPDGAGVELLSQLCCDGRHHPSRLACVQGYVSIDMSVKGEGGHSSMPPVKQLKQLNLLLCCACAPAQGQTAYSSLKSAWRSPAAAAVSPQPELSCNKCL